MIHEHRHLLDWVMYGCAALATGLTLANVALVMSAMAAAISIILGCIRLHDRLRYGPDRRRA